MNKRIASIVVSGLALAAIVGISATIWASSPSESAVTGTINGRVTQATLSAAPRAIGSQVDFSSEETLLNPPPLAVSGNIGSRVDFSSEETLLYPPPMAVSDNRSSRVDFSSEETLLFPPYMEVSGAVDSSSEYSGEETLLYPTPYVFPYWTQAKERA